MAWIEHKQETPPCSFEEAFQLRKHTSNIWVTRAGTLTEHCETIVHHFTCLIFKLSWKSKRHHMGCFFLPWLSGLVQKAAPLQPSHSWETLQQGCRGKGPQRAGRRVWTTGSPSRVPILWDRPEWQSSLHLEISKHPTPDLSPFTAMWALGCPQTDGRCGRQTSPNPLS